MKRVISNFLMLFTLITYSQDGILKNKDGVYIVQFVEEIDSSLSAVETKKIVIEKLKKDYPTLTFTDEGKDFFEYQGGFRVTWKIPLVGSETRGVALRARTEFKDGRYRITWNHLIIGQAQEPLKKFYDSAKKRKQEAIDEKITELIAESKEYITNALKEKIEPKKDKDKW